MMMREILGENEVGNWVEDALTNQIPFIQMENGYLFPFGGMSAMGKVPK
jgi:hypothetical protein